jgi:MFS family permease
LKSAQAQEPPGASAAPPPSEARPRFGALRARNFRLLWVGLIVSNAGSQMQSVAQGYIIYYVLTHSPFWLGMASLAFAVPMVAFPLIGGAIADRVDKLTLLKVTQTGQLLSAAVLTLVTWSGNINVWWILATSFVGATFLAADNPARQALLPELVAREDLISAAALNGSAYTGAALIGPALGGFLLGILGPTWLFALNTSSFAAVLAALFLMRGVHSAPHAAAVPIRQGIGQLAGYVKQTRLVALLLVLSAATGFFGRSYLPLTPAFARDLLHVDGRGLGLMYAAPGLGALLGAGALAARRDSAVSRRLLVGMFLGFSALLVVYSVTPWFPLSLLLLVGTGLSSQVGATMISTTLQLRVPGALRGRVMSLYAITVIGLASLGALLAGIIAEYTGPGLAVSAGAVVMALALLFVAPRLADMDTA